MRRLELVDWWKHGRIYIRGGSGWGTVFCCYFLSLHDSLVTESGCSGNDGAGKLFSGIKA